MRVNFVQQRRNKMSDTNTAVTLGMGFFVGAVFGVIMSIFISQIGQDGHISDINAALEECQYDLPRSQVCVIVAIVPEEK